MTWFVALVDGENVRPDRVTWTASGWVQATFRDNNRDGWTRRFYPPHRIQKVSKISEDDG